MAATTASESDWLWTPTSDRITAYDEANALDQVTGYTRVGEAESGQSVTVEPVSIEHDGNGNLTSVTNTDSGYTGTLTDDADLCVSVLERRHVVA